MGSNPAKFNGRDSVHGNKVTMQDRKSLIKWIIYVSEIIIKKLFDFPVLFFTHFYYTFYISIIRF